MMSASRPRTVMSLSVLLATVSYVCAQSSNIAPKPGQPGRTDAPLGQFEIVGESIASGQQMFLGTQDKIYFVDKTENNPTQMNGHPVWASEYSVSSNQARPMDVVTNSFCAGGNVLANGTWINVGGNQAVTYGGLAANSQNGGLPYDDPDGGQSIRLLNTCDDQSCDWTLTKPMSSRRWYPSVETLEDGSVIIIGGCDWGGYVNDASQDNPTWELFPAPASFKGPVTSPILTNTLPANLYPLTFLLPSGNLLVQSNWQTVLLDYKNGGQETALDDMVGAVRVYPASGGTAMLPLRKEGNWTATVLFCGGQDFQTKQWSQNWDIAAAPASDSCVTLTPDVSPSYVVDDPLPEGRSMGNFIILPTGKILMLNGAATGTAGYGNVSWAVGQSYADNALLMPAIYDPDAPKGQKWSRDGLSASTIPRMYHSTASILPDGSVIVAGSNPNADYTTNVKFNTEYRVEKFYPSYFNTRRPEPQGLLSQLTYGGPYFNVSLTATDVGGNVSYLESAEVVVLRTGFSTHTMNMGQRFVQLDSTYTANEDGSGILHVSQLPPNPAILAPGPALLFVVVNGIPSVGSPVMVGSGKIETQPTQPVTALPSSSVAIASPPSSNSSDSNSNSSAQTAGNQDKENSARGETVGRELLVLMACAWAVGVWGMGMLV